MAHKNTHSNEKLPKSWGLYIAIIMMGLTAFSTYSIQTTQSYQTRGDLTGYGGWGVSVGGGGGSSNDGDEGDKECDVSKEANPVTVKSGDIVTYTLEITCKKDRDVLIVNDTIGSSSRGYLSGTNGGKLTYVDDSMKISGLGSSDYTGKLDRSSGLKLKDLTKDKTYTITYTAKASDSNLDPDLTSKMDNKVTLSSGNKDDASVTLRGANVTLEGDDSGLDNCSHSAANRFLDITKEHWADCYISQLVDLGVVWGYEDKTFRPDNNITRAELTKIALLINGYKPNTQNTQKSFPDLEDGKWYVPYVNTAATLGIVNGYDDGLFRPDDLVTRAEAVKILLRAAGIEVYTTGEVLYPDVTEDDWYYPYVAYATQTEIVNGFVNGKFGPNMNLTRAEAAKIAANTKNVARL